MPYHFNMQIFTQNWYLIPSLGRFAPAFRYVIALMVSPFLAKLNLADRLSENGWVFPKMAMFFIIFIGENMGY